MGAGHQSLGNASISRCSFRTARALSFPIPRNKATSTIADTAICGAWAGSAASLPIRISSPPAAYISGERAGRRRQTAGPGLPPDGLTALLPRRAGYSAERCVRGARRASVCQTHRRGRSPRGVEERFDWSRDGGAPRAADRSPGDAFDRAPSRIAERSVLAAAAKSPTHRSRTWHRGRQDPLVRLKPDTTCEGLLVPSDA